MANSELSKLKILFMYDFFMKHLNAFDENSAVTVNDIIGYLEEKTGTTFERKSIYADISRINEFIDMTDKVLAGDGWITTEGKKYRKNQLADEITIDEARLIVDAISTTTFVDSDLCEKIVNMFPTYFSDGYRKRILYPHYEKVDRKCISKLNNIRNAIEEKAALKISYGYKLGNELAEKSDKIVSPMTLDWQNNCYYLIAIDNEKAKILIDESKPLTEALKRYRVDRMAGISFTDDKYIDFKSEKIKEQEIRNLIANSISAYSGSGLTNFGITIKGKTRKDTLKAYSAFATKVSDKIKIVNDTKLDKGILTINVTTGTAPTLYPDLFELITFDDVEIEIDNDEIRRKFAEYIKKAAKAAKLERL